MDRAVVRSRSREFSDSLISLSASQILRQHLESVRTILPFDAAQVLVFDRSDDVHRQVTQIAYPEDVARALAEDFTLNWPSPVWYPIDPGDDLPTSISAERDVEGSFCRSDIYLRHLQPAGYLDGITLELKHRGRYVGLANFSSRTAGFYGVTRRRTSAALATLLAHAISATAQELEAVPTSAHAVLVQRTGVLSPMAGRHIASTVHQSGFLDAIAPVFDAPAGEVAFLWTTNRSWYRIVVRRPAEAQDVAAQSVMVVEQELPAPYGLTLTELRVLTRLVSCSTNDAIAESMGVGVRTVHTHISNILGKLNCTRRGQATGRAIRNALFLPENTPETSLAHLLE